MRNIKNRIISFLLCLTLLVPSLLLPVSAEGGAEVTENLNDGTSASNNTWTTTDSGITYSIERTLYYVGDGRYRMTLSVRTDINSSYYATVRSSSKNGIQVIENSGWYVLELWGGEGGKGQDFAISEWIGEPVGGGDGGSRGYLCAMVYLEQGQILVYSIGTNGGQSVQYDDGQGGQSGGSGNGGEHGDTGSKLVGAGGGYSAFYLIDAEEYEYNVTEEAESWVTETSVNIPDDIRVSRYIMIAGGGGGGGAHSLFSPTGGGEIKEPHGGNAGSVTNSNYLSLLGDDYDVPGYVFPGSNGSSSGTSTKYVGRGGTTVPGSDVTTMLGVSSETTQPNDWTGSYSSTVPYGGGGTGNLRGGGGGSGYCGGSGGIMDGILSATNVGGGGGGSSFIAQTVNGKEVLFGSDIPTEIVENYVNGRYNQPLGADVGGASQITYLGSDTDKSININAFESITLDAELTEYFEFAEDSVVCSDLSITTTFETTETGTKLTVAGISSLPSTPSSALEIATLTFDFTAKSDFRGGNAIPAFKAIDLIINDPFGSGETKAYTPNADRDVSEVNVPVHFAAKGNSYTSITAGQSYSVSSLYTDDFASVRGNYESDYRYHGVADISTYSVYVHNTDTVITGTVAPTVNTLYDVKFTVTLASPPDDAVTVGPQNPETKTYSAIAAIGVIAPGEAILNGLSTTVSKLLNYSNGIYNYSLGVNQQTVGFQLSGEGGTYTVNSTTNSDVTSYAVPETGWYYIQAWGGNGGSGGSATIRDTRSSKPAFTRTVSGARGGDGALVGAYLYLTEGQTITFSRGSTGSSGSPDYSETSSSWSTIHAAGTGGFGGNPTRVEINGTPVIIAGGGGGGGGSGVSDTSSLFVGSTGFDTPSIGNGTQGTTSKTISGTLSNSYVGGRGGNASASGTYAGDESASGGRAGTGAASYLNPDYGNVQNGQMLSSAAYALAEQFAPSKKTGTDGQVSITLVETPKMVEERAKLSDIELEISLSKYFDIDVSSTLAVDMQTKYNSTYSRTANADGSYTVTYSNSSYGGQVAKFTYKIEERSDGSKILKITDCLYTASYTIDDKNFLTYESGLTFVLRLKPKEGFFGGNDVPILGGALDGAVDTQEEKNADFGIRVKQPSSTEVAVDGYETYNVPANEGTYAADYANVEIGVDLSNAITTFDKTVNYGESFEKSELYDITLPSYSGADSWKADFVNITLPTDETLTPLQNTVYGIELEISAKDEPRKATEGPAATSVSTYKNATVYVNLSITYNLTNLTHDGLTEVLNSAGFSFTLTPERGYLLPESISVTNSDGEIASVTYDKETGRVVIPPSATTKPITVTAEAKIPTYSIYYVYDDGVSTETLKHTEGPFAAGTQIDCQPTIESLTPSLTKEGYKYTWRADTEDDLIPTEMPAKDLWIYGTYEKEVYKVTVNYVNQDLSEAFPSESISVEYGDSYSIPSPTKEGYLADILVVSGTMGAGNVTVTVTYSPSQNQLIIVYVKPNGVELAREIYTVETDAAYSYSAKTFTGYTADISLIEGTMSGSASVTKVVNCTPDKYGVTFNYHGGYGNYEADAFAGATMEGENGRQVEFENIYGYNAATDTVEGLPTPIVLGFEFAGWYTDPSLSEDSLVSDTTEISTVGDKVLYAKWKSQEFKLTVNYKFIYTDGDFLPDGKTADGIVSELITVIDWYEYGESYAIYPNNYEGYTPYIRFGMTDQTSIIVDGIATVTGTMPAASRVITVTYTINVYNITFKDNGNGENIYSDILTVDTSIHTENFSTEWDAFEIKHGVDVVYNEEEMGAPAHAVTENYTYTFTGWESSTTNVIYSGVTPDFPIATESVDYYAQYNADENIAVVTYSGSTLYFTSISSAIEYIQANTSSTVTMKLRRNSGNPEALDVSLDPIAFSTATNTVTLTIDINGLRIYSESGVTPVSNISGSKVSITLTDTSDVKGSIECINPTGDAIAVNIGYGALNISQPITIYAKAENGTATATVVAVSSITLSSTSTNTVQFVAEGKNAVGINLNNNILTLNNGQITVNGSESAVGILNATTLYVSSNNKITVSSSGSAIGILKESGIFTLNNTAINMAVNGAESAIGFKSNSGATLTLGNTTAYTNCVTVTSEGGTAYGVYNSGTLSKFGAEIEVTGKNAYGIYNLGSITHADIQAFADVRAIATDGEGIGLVNAGATDIGSSSSFVTKGHYYGSTYSISAQNGNIYLSGELLYFNNEANDGGLNNVTIKEKYEITIADGNSKYPDYYRLAVKHTLTFVTGEGTPIASITQFYNTPLVIPETTLFGYGLVGWFEDEGYATEWSVPSYMPNRTITLYAKWELFNYAYTLDNSKTYHITLYGSQYGNTSTVVYESDFNANTLYLPDKVKTENMTYRSSSTLYVHSGWYTASSGGTYVNLNGDITEYADADGNITLYSHWQSLSSVYDGTAVGYAHMMSTAETSAYIDISYYSSSKSYYMYFVVPENGYYKVNYKNDYGSNTDSWCKKYIQIQQCRSGSVYQTWKSNATVSNVSGSTSSYYCQAGDVIFLKTYKYSGTSQSYDSTVSASITPSAEITMPNYAIHSERWLYNVTMPDQDLPILPYTQNPGYKFEGWTGDGTGGNIYTITSDLINTTAWKDFGVLDLSSVWTEKAWAEYSSPTRDFSEFTTTDAVTVIDNGTVSLRFASETLPESAIKLLFDAGLPTGTILTLVDRTDLGAKYYTYTVGENTITELPLTLFKDMESGENFSGITKDFTIQICYRVTAVIQTGETVHLLYTNGGTVYEADIAYSIIDVPKKTGVLPEITVDSSTTATFENEYCFNNDDIALLEKLNPTDRLVVVIKFNDIAMTAGVNFTVNGQSGTIYNGQRILIDTGITLASADTSPFNLSYTLSTMKYNEFENGHITYTLVAMSEEDIAKYSPLNTNSVKLYTYVQTLTLTETPTVSVDKDSISALGGESINVTMDYQSVTSEGAELTPELYVYKIVDGEPTVEADLGLFTEFTTDANGLLASDTASVFSNKEFTATVSASADSGMYLLKFVYNDKYVYVTLRVN